MEQFLSEAKEEKLETVPEPEPELSASEKLKQLTSEEGIESKSDDLIDQGDVTEEKEEEKPEKKDKKSKKRKGPPKGGSFGPTVGGF